MSIAFVQLGMISTSMMSYTQEVPPAILELIADKAPYRKIRYDYVDVSIVKLRAVLIIKVEANNQVVYRIVQKYLLHEILGMMDTICFPIE